MPYLDAPNPTDSFAPMPKPIRIALGVGIAISIVGFLQFGMAHALTAPQPGVSYDAAERRDSIAAWRHFGSFVTLGGLIITAAALYAWARNDQDQP